MSNRNLTVRSAVLWTALRTKSVLGVGLIASALTLAMSLAVVNASAAQLAPTCPRTGPQHVQRNSWAAAHRQLAPKGALAIRLCRYAGLNAHPRGKLVAARLVFGHRTIAMLTREFDSLKRFPRRAIACPRDADAEVLATFVYSHAHQVRIQVHLQGCNPVSNGNLIRTAANLNGKNPDGPRLLAHLRQLTRGPSSVVKSSRSARAARA